MKDKYNMLTFKRRTRRKNKLWYGLFICDCGNNKEVRISAVVAGTTKSCGCHRKKRAIKNGKHAITHGMTNSKIYKIWTKIKLLSNPNSKKYNGSRICQEWLCFETFYDWAKDKYSENTSLVKSNQEYNPHNCYFLDSKLAKVKNQEITCLNKYGYKTHLQNPEIKYQIKQTNIKKYGVANPSILKEIQDKAKQTSLKKYGVEYYAQLPERRLYHKHKTIENGQANIYDGQTTDVLSQKLGIARSTMNARIKKYGIDIALSITKHQSCIESVIENILKNLNIIYIKEYKIEDKVADFFIPKNNLVIEADGLYWHSDHINTDKWYHYNKKKLYNDNQLRSLFFRENEIKSTPNIVCSIIKNALNLNSKKTYGRKCNIIQVDKQQTKDFLNNYHLMGYGRGKSYGLFDNELCSLIQVTNKKNHVEISRFCSIADCNVIGGFSKLINHIEQIYRKPIHTFIDMRYGEGKYLYDLGFTKTNESISFVWVKNDKAVHRMKFPGNSGYKNGWAKMWDCGQAKFVKTKRYS